MSGTQPGLLIPKRYLEWAIPGMALAYSVYYLSDVWGTRFETFIMGALFAALILICAIGIWLARGRKPAGAEKPEFVSKASLGMLVAVTAFIAGLQIFGMTLTYMLWFPLVVLFLGERRPGVILLSALVFWAFIYSMFELLIGSGFPEGIISPSTWF